MKYFPAETCIRAQNYQSDSESFLSGPFAYANTPKENITHTPYSNPHEPGPTPIPVPKTQNTISKDTYSRPLRSEKHPPRRKQKTKSQKAKMTYPWIDRRTYVARKPGLDLPLKIITSTPEYPSSRTGVGFLRTSMEYLRVYGG